MCTVWIIYLCIKYIFPAEPSIVNQIVLFIANPRRSENFRHLTTALLLHFMSGKAIPIGPYEPRTAGKAVSNAEQSLHALEKLGLDVSIEDTARKQK